MAVYLVSGPPGEGKTAFTMRKVARTLCGSKPKPVVTNVRLRPDLGAFVARHSVSRLRPRLRARRAELIDRSVHVLDELPELFRIRVPPAVEGSWVVVLDEAGTWLNSRAWSAKGRDQMIEWFAQHRKLGSDVFLIAQDEDMIDKQIRGLINERIELRNMKRVKRFGVPLLFWMPRPVFLALRVWRTAGGQPFVTGRELYALGWWRGLFDTKQIVAGDYADDIEDAIVLPRPPATADTGTGPATRDAVSAQGRPEGGPKRDPAPPLLEPGTGGQAGTPASCSTWDERHDEAIAAIGDPPL
jgi:hypothetical protein